MQFVSRLFVPALVSFIVGVGIAAYVSMSPIAVMLLLFAATLLFCMVVLGAKRVRYLLFGICALSVALGMLRFSLWADAPNDPVLSSAFGKTLVLRGVVSDEPDVRETSTQLTFSVNELVDGERLGRVEGKMLLIVPRYPEYRYGDVIEIRGELKKPESFSEDDGRVFDYPNYLKTKGIADQMFHPDVTILGRGKGGVGKGKGFWGKEGFVEGRGEKVCRVSLPLPQLANGASHPRGVEEFPRFSGHPSPSPGPSSGHSGKALSEDR